MANVDEVAKQSGGGSPLWTFSLSIYRSPEVQSACLVLQDGSGVDVNILLFMLWLGSEGRELTAADAKTVVEQLEPWRRDVVVPLRTARRALKEPPSALGGEGVAALRMQVKRVELEAERLQQEALYNLGRDGTLGRGGSDPARAAAGNVREYGHLLGRSFPAEPVQTMLDATAAFVARRS